jgi:hypothetical protein
MGVARRNPGAHDQYWQERRRAAQSKGIPVPGTGVTHGHHKPSARNPHGAIHHVNGEWGSKNRKREDADRNLARRAAQDAIAEQVRDL